mgnify:CR=1 FL=1
MAAPQDPISPGSSAAQTWKLLTVARIKPLQEGATASVIKADDSSVVVHRDPTEVADDDEEDEDDFMESLIELLVEMRDVIETVAGNWQGLGLDFEEDEETDEPEEESPKKKEESDEEPDDTFGEEDEQRAMKAKGDEAKAAGITE